MENFADRLIDACRKKNSIVCVGIDPRLEALPGTLVARAVERHGQTLEAAASAYAEFGKRVIDVVEPLAAAVKPQSAFFEMLGPAGMLASRQVIEHAREAGLLVISDVKRSDIGSTAQAYASGLLGEMTMGDDAFLPWGADAVTVSPYLGSDGLVPFVEAASQRGGGVFVLVKTSNKSSGELQDLVANGRPVYEHVAQWVADHAGDLIGESGYSSLGAVVGATYPEQLAALRKLMPNNLILIP
ncbi:MAG TPA: orotidine-5'-phosphate decarboxylase, partial [Planctomycetota bacterium]|nr:orotidine-5'-phosphate decarboxylase [Planctomycetota bacterium]